MNARARRERAILRGRRRYGALGNLWVIQQYRMVAWAVVGLTLAEAYYRLQAGRPMVGHIQERRR